VGGMFICFGFEIYFLVSSLRLSAVLGFHFWGFLGPKDNSGRLVCGTIFVSVCVIHTHGE
jgi:hypothetical protein